MVGCRHYDGHSLKEITLSYGYIHICLGFPCRPEYPDLVAARPSEQPRAPCWWELDCDVDPSVRDNPGRVLQHTDAISLLRADLAGIGLGRWIWGDHIGASLAAAAVGM